MRILIQCISNGLEKRENVNESILKTHTGLCTKARYTRRKFTDAVNNRHRTSQSCQGSEMTTGGNKRVPISFFGGNYQERKAATYFHFNVHTTRYIITIESE